MDKAAIFVKQELKFELHRGVVLNKRLKLVERYMYSTQFLYCILVYVTVKKKRELKLTKYVLFCHQRRTSVDRERQKVGINCIYL